MGNRFSTPPASSPPSTSAAAGIANGDSSSSSPSSSPSSTSAAAGIANGDLSSSSPSSTSVAAGIANGDLSSSSPSSTSAGIANGDGSLAKEANNARRLRIFDEKMRSLCWQKAAVVTGRDPARWRKDVAGNIVCRKFTRCEGCLCHEYDHIIPFSKGGETDPSNCQILQSRVNRSKGDRDKLESDELRHYSCDLTFTDKELDVIEMAVYGNVIRPGLQCRCKSVAEKLGLASRKSKGPEMACELPYKNMGDSG
ncbi:hypothetical protein O6H91_06G063900 [Diphasiastrum complanatum]|uniref:Uncharacterized protein n=1 Tax=Diphasiastrum complanatum TaxID=34168 RepID=A0ACC2DEG7_DIPCM|nr:hypothetical protein O6H91_06G063900 [Diphasiastrum complanatum]